MSSTKKTVAIDLDGVLAEYHGWKGHETIGAPIPGARELLTDLRQAGFVVVIHTTRGTPYDPFTHDPRDPIVVANWLDKHKMPYDSVWTNPGKPVACAYIDDRAICHPVNAKWSPGWREDVLQVVRSLAVKGVKN